jgi:hypothetical protein
MIERTGFGIVLAAALTLVILWRSQGRARSLVGRQPLTRARPWTTMVVFPLALGLFAWATGVTHPERLAWLLSGIVAGGFLGHLGIRKTRFELTPEGPYYTPQAHIGIALAVVFVARIAYRLVEVTWFGLERGHGVQDFVRTPLTLAIIGLLGGYFTMYARGLLAWQARARASSAATGTPRSRS